MLVPLGMTLSLVLMVDQQRAVEVWQQLEMTMEGRDTRGGELGAEVVRLRSGDRTKLSPNLDDVDQRNDLDDLRRPLGAGNLIAA